MVVVVAMVVEARMLRYDLEVGQTYSGSTASRAGISRGARIAILPDRLSTGIDRPEPEQTGSGSRPRGDRGNFAMT